VLARQRGDRARFALETADRRAVRGGLTPHELDGHRLTELDVARSEHDAHAADTENALHFVLRGDDFAWSGNSVRAARSGWLA
jgi:hypothetical protein